MMDYYVRESTITEEPFSLDKEMSASDIIKKIQKELNETLSVLTNVKCSLDGSCPLTDKKAEEPKCLYDEIKNIERTAMNLRDTSHAILNKLFGRYSD